MSSRGATVCCYERPLKEEEGFWLFGALLWAFEYWEEDFTLVFLV
jgi:hypothetical protein